MDTKVALLLLVSLFLNVAAPASSGRRGFRATMVRSDKTINFTRAAQQSLDRLSTVAARLGLDADAGSTQTPLRWDGSGAYDMEFAIGTPPQKLSALADTGSDLIWTKCGACASCVPRGSPSYYPDKSSSFSKLPCSDRLCKALVSRAKCGAGGAECDYLYRYGLDVNDSHHYTEGYLGNETITLGGDAMDGVGFGCTNMSEGNFGRGSGLVGLGRGNLSLVSQLDVGAFSYCLIPDSTKASPLLFGSLANLTGAGVQSTPLLPSIRTFYSVNLQSISFGSATTPGPGTSGAGMVFDSGTTLTYLAEPAYTAAKDAVLQQTAALPRAANRFGFEACFQTSGDNSSFPAMVLHFDGADMALPTANYILEVDDGVSCWGVQSSPSVSIIGNIMQMNFHVRHDVNKSVLSFQQANCESV
uniref:Peptidase A1 domain-containing protein n=1 Tax=Oryza punctata TaxID=4537 RepID=A0A0E0MDZ2_ORYPU